MSYDRPNQAWICGHTDDGNPCPVGPGRLGLCQHAGDCRPVQLDGEWKCNRSPLHGGLCDYGPDVDGGCGIQRTTCTPQASLRKRRGVFVLGCFAVAVAILVLMLTAPWRMEALAPGELTFSHAQILNGRENSNRCSACHSAGDETLAEWLVPAALRYSDGREPMSRSQSDLCLHCHDKSFDRLTALVPHGVTLTQLQKMTDEANDRLTAARGVGSEKRYRDIACSTCHREHHGSMYNLSEMSNKQCASCHVDDFHRFQDHAEFENWPFRRRTRIAFDHTSHQFRHFTKENQTFECNSCHVENGSRDVSSIVSFESCRSCHESSIVNPTNNGIAFFSLPMIDVEALERIGIDVGEWPESAQGDFDGELPPLMQVLLSSDPKAKGALDSFAKPFDFIDVDATDVEELKQAAEIVFGIKRLMVRLSRPSDRKQEFGSSNVTPYIENTIPTFVIGSAIEKWFHPNLGNEAATQGAESVGWFRDDEAFSIGYRPVRHDDAVMQALFETLADGDFEFGSAAGQLFSELRKPNATGQCASCHSIDEDNGHVHVNWRADTNGTEKTLTKFSHRPHLLLPQLRDCSTCHQLDRSVETNANYRTTNPHGHSSSFKNIKKAACSNCHAPRAAGDSCLQCHNYHVHSPHAGLTVAPEDVVHRPEVLVR